MLEDNTTKPALINVPEIPESIDNAVKNLTDYPTLNIGKTFGDLWFLVFGGISHKADLRKIQYAADLEKYQTELDSAISSIPKEKQVEPSLQVTAQALENSKYCVSSEILRQMFVKLISGTMHKDIEPFVHPSFPEILKQLSETDALLLKDLYTSSDRYHPIATLLGIDDGDGKSRTLYSNIFVPPTINLSCSRCSTSISSLERSGLIQVIRGKYLTQANIYDKIKNTAAYSETENIVSQINATENSNHSVFMEKGLLSLTSLGKEFSKVCI